MALELFGVKLVDRPEIHIGAHRIVAQKLKSSIAQFR